MSKAFVIVANPTVRWPVAVRIPADDGRIEEWQFTGIFRVLSESEFEVWSDTPEIDDGASAPEAFPAKVAALQLSEVLARNADKFAEVLVGWDGVMSESGEPVPFSVELFKAQVTGKHGRALSVGINKALGQIRYGVEPDQPGAALGNSVLQPADG